jgi:hemolysin III
VCTGSVVGPGGNITGFGYTEAEMAGKWLGCRPVGWQGSPWNYDRDEIIADGVIHVIGVCFGLIGAVTLIVVASRTTKIVAIESVFVYAVGLLAMLGFSAAYNLWPASETKRILRRFDHSAIFVLIAGTYTPFMAQLKISLAGGLLTGIWITAGLGVVLKLVLPGRLDRVAVVLYLLLGWSGVMLCGSIIASLPRLTLWLLAAGGALYSIGVVFHLWESLRFQNAIWHAFVLFAAECHYAAVLDYVVLEQA